jgi:AcrR family transcriptional regulator
LTIRSKPEKPIKRDPEGVRRDILQIATAVFAESGLSGARIDEIAARTKTSKRMIYYYFGDKEGLYRASLEAAYAQVRAGEEELDLCRLPPAEALARLVAFTFDYHRSNPDFIRLVMIENIHNANHLSGSDMIRSRNTTVIDRLADIIRRGQEADSFRPDLDPVELHWQISALSFFNVSNRPTFSVLFGGDLYSAAGQHKLRTQIVEMILRFVRIREEPAS